MGSGRKEKPQSYLTGALFITIPKFWKLQLDFFKESNDGIRSKRLELSTSTISSLRSCAKKPLTHNYFSCKFMPF